MTFPALLFAPIGLLLALLGYPMMKRKVPPNRVYGLRVPATLRNERVWYEANAASGRDMMIVGTVVAVVALVLSASGVPNDVEAGLLGALLGGLAIGTTVRGVALANRLEKEERR